MKLTLFLVLTTFFATCLTTRADDHGNGFIITGEVSNIPDSTEIRLLRSHGDLLSEMAKTYIIDGSFTLNGEAKANPEILYINSNDPGFPNYLTLIWVSPGADIKIKGDDKLIPLWEITSDIPQQKSYSDLITATMPEFKEFLKVGSKEAELVKILFADVKGNNDLNDVRSKLDSIQTISQKFHAEIKDKKLEYLKKAPVDEIWLDEYKSLVESAVMGYDNSISIESVKELYPRIPEDDLKSEIGMSITKYLSLDGILKENDMMADGDLFDIEGNKHSLSEYKGKYILLDFWSAGCGPCVMAIPEAEEIAGEYAKILTFISISQDPEDIWKEYVASKKMKGLQMNELKGDNPGLAEKYGTRGIPHYVLINPEGRIKKMWTGYGEGHLKQIISEQLSDE